MKNRAWRVPTWRRHRQLSQSQQFTNNNLFMIHVPKDLVVVSFSPPPPLRATKRLKNKATIPLVPFPHRGHIMVTVHLPLAPLNYIYYTPLWSLLEVWKYSSRRISHFTYLSQSIFFVTCTSKRRLISCYVFMSLLACYSLPASRKTIFQTCDYLTKYSLTSQNPSSRTNKALRKNKTFTTNNWKDCWTR